MKVHYLPMHLLMAVFMISCATSNIMLDVQEEIRKKQVQQIKVTGVKGKGLPGSKRKLKFDHSFTGVVKDGWNRSSDIISKTPGGIFSAETTRRSLLSNFGLDINDVVSKTSDTYQFRLSDTSNSLLVYCTQQYFGKSTNYKAGQKADFSIASQQTSTFGAALLSHDNSATGDWFLEMGYSRETPSGIIATVMREGMAIETGFITNQSDTIFIHSLFIKKGNVAGVKKSEKATLKVVGGYAFQMNNQIIGMVDLFNTSLSFFAETSSSHKLLIAAAGTALLLRNR